MASVGRNPQILPSADDNFNLQISGKISNHCWCSDVQWRSDITPRSLEDIVEGLPEEYGPLAAIIKYCTEPCDILDAELMLLSHEAKIEKHKKLVLAERLSINVAHTQPIQHLQQNAFQSQNNPNYVQSQPQQPNPSYF